MMRSHALRRTVHSGAGLLRGFVPRPKRPPVDFWEDMQQTPEPLVSRLGAPSWVPFARWDFTGQYVHSMMTLEVPTSALEKVTASYGLSLSQPRRESHPLILTAGYQLGVRELVWPGSSHMNYLETILAIPGVFLQSEAGGYSGPFTLPVRIDADELTPVLLGLAVGYPKHVSRMVAMRRSLGVSPCLGGAPFLEMEFQPYGEMGPPRQLAHFDDMLRMLKYPILTRTLLSPRVYTYIYWDFDHAVMQPVEASIKVAADLPGLAAGRYHLRGYDESRFGAARVSVPWETAGPFPRSAITGQLQPVVPPVETSLRMHPPG